MTASRILILFFFLSGILVSGYSQNASLEKTLTNAKDIFTFENKIYNDNIKSVEFFLVNRKDDFPIINLGSEEKIKLAFDDLKPAVSQYFIKIEHCNADWKPSPLSTLEFSDGINEEAITEFHSSQNINLPYIHYEIIFPTANLKPIVSGNYVLKVFEDSDQNKLLLTRRFYVVNPLTKIIAELIPYHISSLQRNRFQKINAIINSSLPIENPRHALQLHVFQNQRPDQMITTNKLANLNRQEYHYNAPNSLVFEGNNEFRTIDLRQAKGRFNESITNKSAPIALLTLYPDINVSNQTYTHRKDNNGRFTIPSSEENNMNYTEDYINVVFSLKTDAKINGNIYIVGGFNDFKRSAQNKLYYNVDQGIWQIKQQLKQGIYDYEYVLEDENGVSIIDVISGSHYQTNNEYQIVVYYRQPRTSWDQIIGYTTISTTYKNIKRN